MYSSEGSFSSEFAVVTCDHVSYNLFVHMWYLQVIYVPDDSELSAIFQFLLRICHNYLAWTPLYEGIWQYPPEE